MPFSVFCRPRIKAVTAPPAPDPLVKKWNPGNYIATSSQITSGMWTTIKNRLAATPQWKGALLRYDWTMLERAQGEYGWTESGVKKGFDDIDQKLDEIAALSGRRLVIMLYVKNFGATTYSVPAYMRTDVTYKDPGSSLIGQYHYDSQNGGEGGWVPCLHVTAVKDRFIALLNEFATRYDNTARGEYLEAIILNEASIAFPDIYASESAWNTATNGQNVWYSNMANVFAQVRPNFARTIIAQWINAPRAKMESWVPTIRDDSGIAIGIPDVCSRDRGLWFSRNNTNVVTPTTTTPTGLGAPGNIEHCRASTGTVPILLHISSPALRGSCADRSQNAMNATNFQNYLSYMNPVTTFPDFDSTIDTTHGGTPYQTKGFIRDFAVDYLGGSHLFWLHDTTADRDGSGRTVSQATDFWISGDNNITTRTTRPSSWL